MRRVCLFLLVCSFFYGCKDTGSQVYFNEIKPLQGKTCIAAAHLLDPWSIAVTEDYFVVVNDKSEPLVNLYERSSMRLLQKFLTIGKGPFEVRCAGQLQTDEDTLYVSGIFEKKVLRYVLKEVENNPAYQPSIIYQIGNLPEKYQGVGDFVIGNGLVVGSSNLPSGRILVIDSEADTIYYMGKFPSKDKVALQIDDAFNALLYSSSMAMSPDRKKMVLSTYEAGLMDLFRIEGKRVLPVWSHVDFYPEGIELTEGGAPGVWQPLYTRDARNGYITTCATDNYAYSLFSGKKLSERDYAVSNRVRVVSWDGKESFEYLLDRPVKRIAVSPDDKVLYGLGMNEEKEPEVIAFDL